MAEILVSGLQKRFGRQVALRGVSLRVRSGALVGLVGADGAGKSTLLACIAGLLQPDEGRVLPAGARDGTIGLARQGFHLYDELSVQENLAFVADLVGLTGALRRERIEAALGASGLRALRNERARNLSGGMRQKLAVVAAVLHEPPVVLLDEPMTGVDPISRRELWDLVAALHAAGRTIVLATADFADAERCDEVVFLHEGHVLAQGAPDVLRGEHASLEEAFLEAER